jgi:hypothetical protein
MKHILLLLCVLSSTAVAANSQTGTVCFGNNLAIPASEHTDRLYLKIDDSEKLYFNRPQNGPVLANLDINKMHMVKVYFDDQLGKSWTFNYSKLNTQSVIIWRAAGSWRMEPSKASECK